MLDSRYTGNISHASAAPCMTDPAAHTVTQTAINTAFNTHFSHSKVTNFLFLNNNSGNSKPVCIISPNNVTTDF